ncbi:hypothetical protein FISHEDRAFT_74687 [Fistulina hepatica ATCC 64428]|uniref:Uncharacterized protein n=1 Tax=Fistulina hepatica ATCC 64428 TaxID=1128425 RepID=A0A0D7A8S0_9AGAR|nr:hypothetical protein FISHEDRAFT_74687 [Fistulina hepatica ATCC 64428]
MANAKFFAYYKAQRIAPDGGRNTFVESLREHLLGVGNNGPVGASSAGSSEESAVVVTSDESIRVTETSAAVPGDTPTSADEAPCEANSSPILSLNRDDPETSIADIDVTEQVNSVRSADPATSSVGVRGSLGPSSVVGRSPSSGMERLDPKEDEIPSARAALPTQPELPSEVPDSSYDNDPPPSFPELYTPLGPGTPKVVVGTKGGKGSKGGGK